MSEKSIREMLLCQREKLCGTEPIVLDSKKAEQSQQEALTNCISQTCVGEKNYPTLCR
jgi:hypothetical protein